ncbi:hypothetical protein FOZ63_014329, partial [Perkinsus olseni]
MCAEASGSPIRTYFPNEAPRGVVPPHAAAACLQESPLMQLLEEGEEWRILGITLRYPTHDHMEYSRLVDDIDVTQHKFMSNLTILGTSTNCELIAKALRDVESFKAALPRRVVAETEAPLVQTSKYGEVLSILSRLRHYGLKGAGLDPPHNCMILTHIPRGGRKEETNR